MSNSSFTPTINGSHLQTILVAKAAHFVGIAKSMLERWNLMLSISRERRLLSKLPIDVLVDMGIDPADAWVESKRACWDIPVNRINR